MFVIINFLLHLTLLTQQTPCGVVEDIIYPVDSMETATIARGYDDFSLFRARWEGNHVGLDVAFREQGSPVYAVARGRVTYSDIEGWGTERGVVILEHFFPDGSRRFTVYGHVEETDEYRLPEVNSCVERGDIIAAVGWPASSAQHLHYEVRDFLPDDGGPGYTDGNPLAEGWYHPLDFTMLWRLRLQPGFLGYATFDLIPNLPPALLANATVAIASGETVAVYSAPDTLLWRVNMDSIINGIAALPNNRVVVRSRSGQTAVISSGQYEALWTVEGEDVPFINIGETLIFVTTDGGIAAYNPAGDRLWSQPATSGFEDVEYFQANGGTFALSLRTESGSRFMILDSAGQILYETTFDLSPLITPVSDGSWGLVADSKLMRVTNGEMTVISPVDDLPRRTAQLAMDIVGNAYFYVGDSANTLIAFNASGGLRWQTTFPAFASVLLPPLLDTDNGCLLYGLDSDGQLTLFNTSDGSVVNQVQLYAGGRISGRPAARALQVDPNNTVLLGAGFLTITLLDGNQLGQDALEACLLG